MDTRETRHESQARGTCPWVATQPPTRKAGNRQPSQAKPYCTRRGVCRRTRHVSEPVQGHRRTKQQNAGRRPPGHPPDEREQPSRQSQFAQVCDERECRERDQQRVPQKQHPDQVVHANAVLRVDVSQQRLAIDQVHHWHQEVGLMVDIHQHPGVQHQKEHHRHSHAGTQPLHLTDRSRSIAPGPQSRVSPKQRIPTGVRPVPTRQQCQ